MENLIEKLQQSKAYSKLGDVWLLGMGLQKLKSTDGSPTSLQDVPTECVTRTGLIETTTIKDRWVFLGLGTKDFNGLIVYTPKVPNNLHVFCKDTALYNSRIDMGNRSTQSAWPDIYDITQKDKPSMIVGQKTATGQLQFFTNGLLREAVDNLDYAAPEGYRVNIALSQDQPIQFIATINEAITLQEQSELYEILHAITVEAGIAVVEPEIYVKGKSDDPTRGLLALSSNKVLISSTGDVPTEELKAPIEIKRSTSFNIRAANEDETIESTIQVVDLPIKGPGYDTVKHHGAHAMMTLFLVGYEELKAALISYKEEGNTFIWGHTEYDPQNPDDEKLKLMVRICEEIDLLFTLPFGGAPGQTTKFLNVMLASKAAWKPYGKLAMVSYMYNGQPTKYVIEELEALGLTINDVDLLPHFQWPNRDGNGGYVGLEENGGGPGFYKIGGISGPVGEDVVREVYNKLPYINGYTPFLNTKEHGRMVANVSRQMGHIGGESPLAYYASFFYDLRGLRGLMEHYQYALEPLPHERSNFMTKIWNDIVEGSYSSRLPVSGPDRAFGMIANWNIVAGVGNNRRVLLPEHDGEGVWTKPGIRAYLDNKLKMEFTEDKVVFMHIGHPVNAKTRSERPKPLIEKEKYGFTKDWWNGSIYNNPWQGDNTQPVATAINNLTNFIEVGFHLKADAELFVNGKSYGNYKAGWAVIMIDDFGKFRGNPYAGIKRPGEALKISTSPAAIMDDVFNGCWGPFIVEGSDLDKPTPTKPVVKIVGNTITATGKGNILVSDDWLDWRPFNGVEQFAPTPHLRFKIEETETSNESAITITKAIV